MEISKQVSFNSPAVKVWALLENFGAIEAWWPSTGAITIRTVEIEGAGVGMIRHIYNHGMSTPVSERLDFLDPENQTLILSIVGDRPAGITAYVAIARLTPTSEATCSLDYQGFVTCAPGREERVMKNLEFTWQTMFSGLEQAALNDQD